VFEEAVQRLVETPPTIRKTVQTEHVKKFSSEFKYYVDSSIESYEPGRDVDDWLYVLGRCLWALGECASGSVGFTVTGWRTERIGFSQVFVVPKHLKPSLEFAAYCVARSRSQDNWMSLMIQILASQRSPVDLAY